jgi:hypothetical protein
MRKKKGELSFSTLLYTALDRGKERGERQFDTMLLAINNVNCCHWKQASVSFNSNVK